MEKQSNGGPAFPSLHPDEGYGGMSLRDYFAGQALPQAIAHERDVRSAMIAPGSFRFDVVADAAYSMADAMLRVRSETR